MTIAKAETETPTMSPTFTNPLPIDGVGIIVIHICPVTFHKLLPFLSQNKLHYY